MTTIHACRFWSDTGIELEAGRKYGLRAEGHWWDAFIRCSAAGYRNTLFRALENHRRVPGSDWFALIGSIDRDPAATFEIGTELLLTAPRTGRLWCFANDLPGMYWNNWGAVELTSRPV